MSHLVQAEDATRSGVRGNVSRLSCIKVAAPVYLTHVQAAVLDMYIYIYIYVYIYIYT